MNAGTKRLLDAMEQRMNLAPPPKDLKEASSEQLAQIIGLDKAKFAAMTDDELQAIINGETSE